MAKQSAIEILEPRFGRSNQRPVIGWTIVPGDKRDMVSWAAVAQARAQPSGRAVPVREQAAVSQP